MSTRVTGRPNDLARQLLVFETRKAANPTSSPALSVCEKMREPLGKLLGVDGFRSLVSRALVIAGSEIAWLRGIEIAPGGGLRFAEGARAKLSPAQVEDGEVALVAELLGLLVTFIGSYLTEQLLHGIWPKLRSLNSPKEGAS